MSIPRMYLVSCIYDVYLTVDFFQLFIKYMSVSKLVTIQSFLLSLLIGRIGTDTERVCWTMYFK